MVKREGTVFEFRLNPMKRKICAVLHKSFSFGIKCFKTSRVLWRDVLNKIICLKKFVFTSTRIFGLENFVTYFKYLHACRKKCFEKIEIFSCGVTAFVTYWDNYFTTCRVANFSDTKKTLL